MIVDEMISECALHVHDPNLNEIGRTTWLAFITSASRYVRSSGWLVPVEDDESLTITVNVYDYDIPRPFAYISDIWREDRVAGVSVFNIYMPQDWWAPGGQIRMNGGRPVLNFHNQSYLESGFKLKIVGQRRPTVYSDVTQSIDPGMEGMIQERTLYYAFRYLGAGMSELARWRQQMSVQSFQSSEQLLARHPQEFRVNPSSLVVPGRG